jgi:hypothetical protein
MTTCAFGCGKSVDETKAPQDLTYWEQLTVTTTRNGGSEHLLSVMCCPSCAPAPGKVVLSLAPAAPAPKAIAAK